jgi:hypothetical protein
MTYTYDEHSFSDLHKDARGFRPGQDMWAWWTAAAPADKQLMWDSLVAELERNSDMEEKAQAKAVLEFEERVAHVIANGAKDREMALRWIFDAEDEYTRNDPDYFCFQHGLPYGYFKKAA